MKEPMAKIFLVRHGEAEQNVLRILSSMSNGAQHGLTERGREQIRHVAAGLQMESIEMIFASPLRRTVETAEIISQSLGLWYALDDRLRETDFGQYAGGPVETFWRTYPRESDRIETGISDGVESFRSVRTRVSEFWQETSTECHGKNIVVISHGDTLQMLCGVICGQLLEDTLQDWNPKLGEVKELAW